MAIGKYIDLKSLTGAGGGAVSSVFGRTGAVVAVTNDYTWAQIDKAISSLADITTKSHTLLTDIGTNTHAQIDTHIGLITNPHGAILTQTNLNLTESIRLDNLKFIKWRNGANTADLNIMIVSSVNDTIIYGGDGTRDIYLSTNGHISVGGGAAPTARMHLPAGTATAGTAPFKFTPGINLTAAAVGAMEMDDLDLYFTDNQGTPVRHNITGHIKDISDPHGVTLTQTNLNITGTFDISNTAPSITLTDTTVSAKSLKIDVDGNIVQIREVGGASGSLVSLDLANNRFGLGIPPTATLHLKAGTTAANTAPLKLAPGSLNTTPEDGTVEYDGTVPYFTVGTIRRLIGIVSIARVAGSDATTSSTTLVDITGLSIALEINSVYEITAALSVLSSETVNGNKYGINYSVAGATIEAQVWGYATNTVPVVNERLTAFNTASANSFNREASAHTILIKGIVVTGANAGNLTVQHLKITSGTATCYINSFLAVTKIG